MRIGLVVIVFTYKVPSTVSVVVVIKIYFKHWIENESDIHTYSVFGVGTLLTNTEVRTFQDWYKCTVYIYPYFYLLTY